MPNARLQKQLTFLLEIDRLKNILRQTSIRDGSRRENSAEHSWHIALMAVVLSEHAADNTLDLPRVIKMLLTHDLVEIDAGDTFCYDESANQDKAERENKAAERIFNLLPQDQAREIRLLWDEFEAQETPESRFANALDRLQPIILNYENQGGPWREHNITRKQVETRNQNIADGAPALWEHVLKLTAEATAKGYLAATADSTE